MKSITRFGARLVVVVCLTMTHGAAELVGEEYDRPDGRSQSRSVVVARHGIVATSEPLAAQTGLRILQEGGNAVDAAIATNAMLGLTEPMSCGIGGDLFCIYWDAKTEKLYGLNASGRSPARLNRQVFADRGLDHIPLFGQLTWSVPGCVSGWDELRRRFGTLGFDKLLAPAIAAAEDGFPVSQIISASWQGSAANLRKWPDSAATFLVDGRAPRFGEVFRNPRLAATYRAIATDGAAAFYHGSVAERIVAFSEQNGGYFSMSDFAEHRSEWVEPVSTNYRGYDVWELPPNGQGIAVLEMLNVIEGFDVRAMGRGSADWLHLFVEAKKLAFADRARYYADPAFGDLPISELISKSYGTRQRQRIDMQRAAQVVPPGDPRLRNGDTVYLTVVDKDRNCCSLIQSNFHGFGSHICTGDVGFAMQNRGALFTLEDDHPNRLEPRKRPFHTIIPAMVTKDGKPWFCFGVMGGDMQPQGHVQVLVNLIDFGLNVQEAGDAARVRHDGSATPTGRAAQGSGVVIAERGVSDDVVRQLEARGHRVRRGGSGGGYQGILIDHEQGVLFGGTESRKDGLAVGY
ncbi:MAG: gamma-glutamyltransferase [Planctomycetota bacterium]|nr:MAG: gamma-glutamyltransferase [Planctomycetota bacterium]REJ87536.1 MAG: gamma-glutamyltransferase [Planctomycetota bacterium]